MRTLLTVVLAAAAGTSAWLGAQQPTTVPPPQQPQVTFRLEADYIEVDAVVTDAQGNVVRNLQREDFEVLEDKRPQNIDVFSFVDIPLERDDRPLYRPTAVEPDVVTNERELEGRIYVLLLDSNHVPATNSLLVKKAARHFIDRYFGANDLASVVHAQTGTVDANQEFTSSKPALRAAVEKFVGEKVRSKALNVYDFMGMRFGRGFDPLEARDPHMLERAAKADATIDAIMRVSRYMSGIRGRRKAVLLFSEGIDFNLDDTIGPRRGGLTNPFGDNTANEALHASGIRDHMQEMYEVATRANVAVYSIDPRGLASESDNLLQASGFPVDVDPGLVPQLTSSVREELRRELGTLRTFSEVTGGVAHVGTNDFDAGFRRVVLENSSYLRARLPSGRAQARRQVPPDYRSRETAWSAGAGAARLLRRQDRGRAGAAGRSDRGAAEQPARARRPRHAADDEHDERHGLERARVRDRRALRTRHRPRSEERLARQQREAVLCRARPLGQGPRERIEDDGRVDQARDAAGDR